MSVTAKEIAKIMGVSEATVSMALNGKKGVSVKRREQIISTAKALGYDFTKIDSHFTGGTVNLLIYAKYMTIIDATPFFKCITDQIESECKKRSMRLNKKNISKLEDLTGAIKLASKDAHSGTILIATEMTELELTEISRIENAVIVAVDCVYNSPVMNYVCTNNRQGAYMATEFLVRQFHTQPGYLKSSYGIANFHERANGFFDAIRAVGLSPSQCIIHQLSPSTEDAYSDMKRLLENNVKIARCYFADNDFIAMGAMKALKEYGYRIPRDVAVIGFDNTEQGAKFSPPLSSVSVPARKIGNVATEQLCMAIINPGDAHDTVTTLINTTLVLRVSTDL